VRTSKIALCAGFFLCLQITIAHAQTTRDIRDSLIADAVKSLLVKKQFIFFVQSVVPPGGQGLPLAGENYTMRLFGDSVQFNLPYVGRSHQAVTDYSQVGFNFKTGGMDYEIRDRKRGGWNVQARLHNSTNVSQFAITVLKNGSATLLLTPRNKQPISYQGNIAEKE
jgi:hypothetical protein